ncbi:RNA recognition motif domain-containing protein [Dioscorea alata]|uniref:RNA recognition motif domain-containing protein n=1 Tax=Dioscorea alata TaxID=55571 RepID=A0ACB7W6I6_DIOAL|nr:RNA recognition motif domain-containing protein [Dioscorea alata]
MAFCKLIRKSILNNLSSTGPRPVTHLLNATRGFSSSSKLFIGGLSFSTDDKTLKEAFSSFGNVLEARVITDRESGRSRGFGFVLFESNEDANEAMSSMDGQELNGRAIRVSYASDDRKQPRFSGGGGHGNTGF